MDNVSSEWIDAIQARLEARFPEREVRFLGQVGPMGHTSAVPHKLRVGGSGYEASAAAVLAAFCLLACAQVGGRKEGSFPTPQELDELRQAPRPESQLLDLVMLGIMAVWQVDGIVQRGHVSPAWVSESNDVGRLLAEALDHPMSRETLTDPSCEKIAIGVLSPEPGRSVPGLAVLIATYAMFSEASHAEMQAEILKRFTRARAEHHLGPPDHLSELDGLVMNAANRIESGERPKQVLSRLLRESLDVIHRPVNGWFREVTDLDEIEFPEDFLTRRNLSLAISVSRHQPEGEPWGRYVVMLVAAEPEGRTATWRSRVDLSPL